MKSEIKERIKEQVKKLPREELEKRYLKLLFESIKDKKKFVIQNTHHVTTVDDGVIFDTWDTSNETVWAFWYK